MNLYTYCSNNPIRYYDPTGHWQVDDEKLSKADQEKFGEASLMAQIGNGEDGFLKTGVEYKNVLGDKNEFKLKFLSKDLYKDSIGLDINGNILKDIKYSLESIDIGVGVGAYVIVGGSISVGVEPVRTYQIIYEELCEYGYIK